MSKASASIQGGHRIRNIPAQAQFRSGPLHLEGPALVQKLCLGVDRFGQPAHHCTETVGLTVPHRFDAWNQQAAVMVVGKIDGRPFLERPFDA
jgi:hypothetical protein